MTRTDPPDILVSTVYRDINVTPSCVHPVLFPPSAPCDFHIPSTLEGKQANSDKRYCRSFDFVKSLDDLETRTASMEYPYRRSERHVVHPDMAWNALAQQEHLRFSSPDLFNTRLSAQLTGSETGGDTWANGSLRARSKSAPRVKTTLTPVHFEESPPMARRGREAHRVPRDPPRRQEASPRQEPYTTTNRAPKNEVHPIKLQPQGGDARRCSPLYVSDRFSESRPATSPHVRCRVDIKPDEAVLEHTAQKMSMSRAEVPWQRYSSGGSRSLIVPRQCSSSRTPTPTDSLISGDYRQPYMYPTYMSNSYLQPFEVPVHSIPSPTDTRGYFGRERRAHSTPNVPSKYFYGDDTAIYPGTPRTYFHEDSYGFPSQNFIPKVQYMQNPRTRMIHTTPPPFYPEMDPYQYPLPAMYPKNFSTSDMGSYIMQSPLAQTYYEEDPKVFQPPSKVLYADEFLTPSPEHHIPSRGYHTEGRRRPKVPQPAEEWYSSDLSSYATVHHSVKASQFSRPKVRQDAVLTPWCANTCTEPARLGNETRPYSKSWDNILNPRMEREHLVQRGKSHENLLCQKKRTLSPDDRRQPVVVNLSSSPRRYAALSLSETSLTDRSPTDGGRHTMGKFWFVTPEITITDNDLCAGGHNKMEARSASWDVLDSGKAKSLEASSKGPPLTCSVESTKEKSHNSSSLQQSLEQLDELLADLVIDYKPPVSRRPSEGLIDQLKKLINEDDAVKEDSSKEDSKDSEDSHSLNQQPTLEKANCKDLKDLHSSNDELQKNMEECSPDQSPDENETMVCSNSRCQRTETVFNACLYFKSCHSCYTYYCSRSCRRDDWDSHKENCLYGRISGVCRHILKYCRETVEVHKAFSRIAKVGYLSRGRGVLFLGFPNPGSSSNFLLYGLESLLMSPTYLSLRELDGYKDNLGEYSKELQQAGNDYDPTECFLLNVSIAVGDQVSDGPSPRVQVPTVRKYAKVSLASSSPEKTLSRKENDMETLILTPPPGMADINKEGEEGRKAREICFINIQRELRTRGVFLRHEYPSVYQQLCDFVESNKSFTPTTIYPIDKRTGKQFMCMIMAASEPRTLDWLGAPNLLDGII